MNSLQKAGESLSLARLASMNAEQLVDDKAMRSLLNNYAGVVRLAKEAFNSFLQGILPDPLVGENACQIRAVMYCEMARNERVINVLKGVALRIEEVFVKSVKDMEIPKRSSLEKLLEAHSLDVCIPQEQESALRFILFGHILTVTKNSECLIKETVSLKESNDLKKIENVTAKFAKELITMGRKELSRQSIAYLLEKVHLLSIQEEIEAITDHVLLDSLGLQTAPMFPGMRILLEEMKENHIPIVLKNQIICHEKKQGELALLFAPEDGVYKKVEHAEEIEPLQSVVVVEAATVSEEPRDIEKLSEVLSQVGIETIIFANSAAHSQYGGQSKNIPPPKMPERERFQEIAKSQGLCAANPALCSIYHIYGSLKGIHMPHNEIEERKCV